MTIEAIIGGIVSFIFTLAMLGLKAMYNGLREDHKTLRNKVDNVQNDLVMTKLTYVQKDDFKEFKDELFSRLDKMEQHLISK